MNASRKKLAFLLIFSALTTSNIYPFLKKKIEIKNESDTTFFVAMYKKSGSSATRVGQITPVAAQETVALTVPGVRGYRMSASKKEKALTEHTPDKAVVGSASVGMGYPGKLSLLSDNKSVMIAGTDKYTSQKAREEMRESVARKSPYYGQVAKVTQYKDSISKKEKEYLSDRRDVVEKALERFLGRTVHVADIPHISVCASGGGMRATLATLGVLKGLQSIKLLDAVEYMTGVSGGTWAIASWLASDKPIDAFLETLQPSIANVPSKVMFAQKALDEYKMQSYTKSLFGYQAGLVDLFGLYLAEIFIKPSDPLFRRKTLSQLASNMHPERFPFLICNSVTPKKGTNTDFNWIEFSPYDVRITDYTIPTWSFMRAFKNGVSTNSMPEPHLGYNMALWGSAFSISLEDVLTKSPVNFKFVLPDSLIDNVSRSSTGHKKRFAAMVPNPLHNLKEATPFLASKGFLPVIDAAHHNNIPLMPFFNEQRQQDILIIVNASTVGPNDFRSMRETYAMLKKRYPGLQFSPDKALAQPLTIWRSERLGYPTIIHIALHRMASFDPNYYPVKASETATTNFKYNPTQFKKITGLTEHNIIHHAEQIKEAIEHAITKRHEQTPGIDRMIRTIKGVI